jgi:endonuclease YncB( thermonuclease family)
VIINGEDVNLEQVEAGMARHYKAYHPGHVHAASMTRR